MTLEWRGIVNADDGSKHAFRLTAPFTVTVQDEDGNVHRCLCAWCARVKAEFSGLFNKYFKLSASAKKELVKPAKRGSAQASNKKQKSQE
jgi:hypothetical protein